MHFICIEHNFFKADIFFHASLSMLGVDQEDSNAVVRNYLGIKALVAEMGKTDHRNARIDEL
jgi:hypothetical protein